MAANRIYLQVDLNSSSAQQNVNALNQSIANTGPVAEKSSAQATSSLNKVSVSVKSVTDSFSGMGAAVAGLGLERLGAGLLALTSDMSRIKLAMEAFTGSAAQAKQLFQELKAVALSGPFELKDIEQAGRRLLAFGYTAQQASTYLQILSDKLASTGASAEDLEGLVALLGRIKEKDFVGALDLLRKLPQQAIPIVQQLQERLSKAFGTPASVKDVVDAIKNGLFTVEAATHDILAAAEKGSKGFGEKMNDASKAFKNLGIEIKDQASLLGEAFTPAVVELANQIGRLLVPLEKFAQYLEGLSPETKLWIADILAAAAAFVALTGAFTALGYVLKPAWEILKLLGPAFGLILDGLAALTPELLIAAGIIAYLTVTLYETVPAVKKFTDNMTSKITGWVGDAKKKFQDMFQSVREEAAKPGPLADVAGTGLPGVAGDPQEAAGADREVPGRGVGEAAAGLFFAARSGDDQVRQTPQRSEAAGPRGRDHAGARGAIDGRARKSPGCRHRRRVAQAAQAAARRVPALLHREGQGFVRRADRVYRSAGCAGPARQGGGHRQDHRAAYRE